MLILVRHGRTAANAAGQLQGRLDQPLDDLGERQALAVAAHVGDVDEVISSPLLRARQTADAFGRPVQIDERWIEIAYGKYEGMPHGDVPSEVWNYWRTDATFVPEGGESAATVDERVRSACDDLVERIGDLDIVVVSHVSPMKSAVAWALGVDFGIAWRTHLSHAAVCRIDVRPQGPVLFSFNERAPLTPLC
jgi:broad specificity phosphatase PhoE